jgi:hypothetical protein
MMEDPEDPGLPEEFAFLSREVARLESLFAEEGWAVERVRYGHTPPDRVLLLLPPVVDQIVEIVVTGIGRSPNGAIDYVVAVNGLCGFPASGKPPLLYWYFLPVAESSGRRNLVSGYTSMGSTTDEVATHIKTLHWVRTDVRMDPESLLGNPGATISVFALAASFLGGILGRASQDAYEVLKRVISRAPRRITPSGARWVVVHDPEHNTVIECPESVPHQAAVQLAAMARTDLSRAHLRWNEEYCRWDRVDETSGDAPTDGSR